MEYIENRLARIEEKNRRTVLEHQGGTVGIGEIGGHGGGVSGGSVEIENGSLTPGSIATASANGIDGGDLVLIGVIGGDSVVDDISDTGAEN